MRALGFVGTSRLAAAQRLLPNAIGKWKTQWCLHNTTADYRFQEEYAEVRTQADGCQWRLVETSKGKLWMGARWRQIIFGPFADEAPQDSVGARLISAAQQALAISLLEALSIHPESPLCDANPKGLGATLNARVVITVGAGADLLLVMLDASLLAEFLPRVASSQVLIERAAAIGCTRLRVKVSLPLTSLSIGEANTLRAGDILQGTTHFLAPLNLDIRDNQCIAKGHLARRGEHLALQLVAQEP